MTKVLMKFVLKSIHLEKKKPQQTKILLVIFEVTWIILKYVF